MKKEFESQTMPNGKVQIIIEDKPSVFSLTTEDGRSFADEYIEDMKSLYPNHLEGVEQLIKTLFKAKYDKMVLNKDYHKELVVTQSLCCCFGSLDSTPDRDASGKYHFEHVICPVRHICPFNGYSDKNRTNKYVVCNPILNTGLSKTESMVADELINTDLSLTQIGYKLDMALNTVKAHSKHIYVKTGVNSRPELVNKLKDQRIL